MISPKKWEWPYWEPITFKDFAALDLPEPTWLIPELIPGDGWTLVVAPPKTGKSIFMAQAAVAATTGEPFLRWGPPPRPLTVLYCQGDAPPKVWHTQIRRIRTLQEAGVSTLRVPLGFLSSELQRTQARAAIARVKPDWIIWDAFEKFLTVQDLNTQQGMSLALSTLKSVNGPCPFALIHHPRKGKPGEEDSPKMAASGHHYLTGDATQIISLTKKTARIEGRLVNDDPAYHFQREDGTGRWFVGPTRPGPRPTQSNDPEDLLDRPLP